MTERILQGPFLTRLQAARRSRTPTGLLAHRPDLLRVDGRWLQEAYFAFQFDRNGVLPGLGAVVQDLKRSHSDIGIADWLVRPNRSLDYSTPLKYLKGGGAVERVLAAADGNGPIGEPPKKEGLQSEQPPSDLAVPIGSATARTSQRRPVTHRLVFGSR